MLLEQCIELSEMIVEPEVTIAEVRNEATRRFGHQQLMTVRLAASHMFGPIDEANPSVALTPRSHGRLSDVMHAVAQDEELEVGQRLTED